MALTYRTGSGGKGSALTIEELDNNFRHFTGSHSITGSLDISGSLNVSGSVTADYFIGDGSQLTNLPIYTGSSSVTGSLEVTGSFLVTGSVDMISLVKLIHVSESLDFPGDAEAAAGGVALGDVYRSCLLYTSPSPRDRTRSRMPSSA